jgi:high-affinity Fe2+/Pb2+ permease
MYMWKLLFTDNGMIHYIRVALCAILFALVVVTFVYLSQMIYVSEIIATYILLINAIVLFYMLVVTMGKQITSYFKNIIQTLLSVYQSLKLENSMISHEWQIKNNNKTNQLYSFTCVLRC